MFKILLLDVDGVLNGHEKLPGSLYCGIRPDCMARLNRVIAATGCVLVLSSAWRYMLLGGCMNLRGFEYLLRTHGLLGSLVVGITQADEMIPERGGQIIDYVRTCGRTCGAEISTWAVVDDMQIELGAFQHRLVKTDGAVGMTDADADKLIALLLEDTQ